MRSNKIVPLWHACLASLSTCAKGVQFYCPSGTYSTIPYCAIFPFLIHCEGVETRNVQIWRWRNIEWSQAEFFFIKFTHFELFLSYVKCALIVNNNSLIQFLFLIIGIYTTTYIVSYLNSNAFWIVTVIIVWYQISNS